MIEEISAVQLRILMAAVSKSRRQSFILDVIITLIRVGQRPDFYRFHCFYQEVRINLVLGDCYTRMPKVVTFQDHDKG